MGPKGEDIKITIVYITLGFLLFALFLILFIAIYRLRLNRHLKDKIHMKANFEHELLQTQIEIQEQTLKTISQEIHDNIGQVLSLAKLHLNTFPPIADQTVVAQIDTTKQLVSKALNDLRALSRSMLGEKISEIGLYESVNNELKILQNIGQCQTSLTITGNPYKLTPQKEMLLFRIVQESFNNAVKHSHSKSIEVVFDYRPEKFQLKIADNGVGFDMAALHSKDTGIGLKNMNSRAALIGGEFSIHSIPGSGTTITIKVQNIQP